MDGNTALDYVIKNNIEGAIVDDFFTQRNLKYTISTIGNGKTASMVKTTQTPI
jgi:hypothetical protein